MKGLLIKDFYLSTTNKLTLPIFALVAIMLLVSGDADNIYFVVAYFSVLCGMMVLTTISYDEFDHSSAFLMTLPVSRELYAVEKYVFTFLATFFGWAASFVATSICIVVKGYQVNMTEWFAGSLATAYVLFIFLILSVPIQIKFGGDKSRMIMIGMIAVVFVIVFTGKALLEALHINAEDVESTFMELVNHIGNGAFIALLIVIGAVIALLSLRISIGVMRKKAY